MADQPRRPSSPRAWAHALTLDVPSIIVVPIDYSLDVAIAAGLGDETVAT